ncbi:MAG: DUF5658 family protein [Candidatus Bathyarchaeia archaeon]
MLSSFATFDLASTLLFLKHSAEEANVLAKSYLGAFGHPTGLILFNLLTTAFLVLILYFSNQTLDRTTGLAKLLGLMVLDGCLAWFVAGAHFVGGTSWFWEAPEMLRHLIGACLYLAPLIAFQHATISMNSKPAKSW